MDGEGNPANNDIPENDEQLDQDDGNQQMQDDADMGQMDDMGD